MDKNSIKRLEAIATDLHDFLELENSERKWLLPMLSKNIQSTIRLLIIIEDKEKSYEEIADEMGYHFNTIKQKLLALKRGGFPIYMSEKRAILETGRKRVLARKSDRI